MILILEGVNGTGKTTMAKLFCELHEFELFRMFSMENHRQHETGERGLNELRGWGVDINTHVEDLYAAEALSILKPQVVLDRSLPSAIAYSQHSLAANSIDGDGVLRMLNWWQLKMNEASKGRALYVLLESDYATSKKRVELESRWFPNEYEYNELQKSFLWSFDCLSIRKIRMNTTSIAPEKIVRDITKIFALL